MDTEVELVSLNLNDGPDAFELHGGSAAGNGAHLARKDKLIDAEDELPLGAKDGISLREPETLDAHTELRRGRQVALRRAPWPHH